MISYLLPQPHPDNLNLAIPYVEAWIITIQGAFIINQNSSLRFLAKG